MNHMIDLVRETALNILKEVDCDSKYANLSLKEHLRKLRLSGSDAALTTKLVYGTLQNQLAIDWVLSKFADLKKANPMVKNILRMGCYQILFLDRIPDSAACDQAVKLCKKYGYVGLSGFVNAVLRNIVRNKNNIGLPTKEQDDIQDMSLYYSYPEWLVEKWVEEYGIGTARMILSPMSEEDYITIRTNLMKTTKPQLEHKLSDMKMPAIHGLYMEEALRICNTGDIGLNHLYKNGFFTVQDESSMIVTHLLDPRPGENVLDACSAPGGKATHMAERMNGQGRIIAWDIHPQRVDLIAKNSRRMGSSIVFPHKQDAREFITALEGKMDRVLVDAPCTGWGVIHKKPDIKIRVNRECLGELLKTQWNILSTCCRYVRPGGVLVYSTCTINMDENQRMVHRFLEYFKDFEIEKNLKLLPQSLQVLLEADGMLQLIPARDDIDGFFITRFKRKE